MVLLTLGLVGPLCGPLVGAEKPNIIYIMSDELGYYELSCMGNPHIQTPRIDQMAREGIRPNGAQLDQMLGTLSAQDIAGRAMADYLLRQFYGNGPPFDPTWTGQRQQRAINVWRSRVGRPATRDAAAAAASLSKFQHWTCFEVGDWLEKNGFAAYRLSFQANDVHGGKLNMLTFDSLPKLGVTQFDHCKALIVNYKGPRSISIRNETLPLSGAGKILKRDLRAPFWEGQGRNVN